MHRGGNSCWSSCHVADRHLWLSDRFNIFSPPVYNRYGFPCIIGDFTPAKRKRKSYTQPASASIPWIVQVYGVREMRLYYFIASRKLSRFLRSFFLTRLRATRSINANFFLWLLRAVLFSFLNDARACDAETSNRVKYHSVVSGTVSRLVYAGYVYGCTIIR